ncbi:hypothetical protein KQI84_13110 [bacterium]|nr:hypothetical protein [bacterium]
MMHDEKPEKPAAVSEEYSTRLKQALKVFAIPIVLAMLILSGNPFRKAPETSARNSCPEKQMRIASAVQQYIADYKLTGQAQFVALFGTEQKDWSPVLVGPTKLLRYPPKCPAHKSSLMFWRPLNDYSIAPTDAGFKGGVPVRCNVGKDRHPYPEAPPPYPTPIPAAMSGDVGE